MTTTQARQPEGIPTGGQFAGTAHSDEVPALPAKPARPAETLRRLRVHNFYPSAKEMAKWPAIYTNDGIDLPDQPIVAHYFQGGHDWWVTEYDPERNHVFGFAQLAGHGRGEWGYSSLTEIEQLRGQFGLPIERELDFNPRHTGQGVHPSVRRGGSRAHEGGRSICPGAARLTDR